MFRNVTLELSLKPFKQTDEAFIRDVCKEIFTGWYPLLKNRESISLMLWCGDGSEILDYSGDLSDEFEWCRFLGTANLPQLSPAEPRETSLHERKQPYMKNPPKMTYEILKTIVRCLREEGKRRFPNAVIRIGETFDIGPEFAVSDFKYKRHPEITTGYRLDKFGFVDATAALHADTRAYAAYPSGIPEGTSFGTFLGKQFNVFAKDLSFDYLWLSNGLGFSANPWNKTGVIFDGESYHPERLSETKKKVFEFWRLFRDACDYPLETRGTNNSVGIDYASDGVPLYDLYQAGLDITAPPNSPWAALNDNYGLEIMGHMTRIAELPNERFPFRYYLHDPWWVNSPWYDRYDNSPSDIYLPMAISRITREGKVESANSLNILTIDNSYGNMPEACINEPLPHLLKAEKDVPDAPAPFVWVYPMREYTTAEDVSRLREMNLGDSFIMEAINDGAPLCAVTSSDAFCHHTPDLYRRSVIVSPVPESIGHEEKLRELERCGIGIILYGTRERLEALEGLQTTKRLDTEGSPSQLRWAMESFGYRVAFDKKEQGTKPPTLALYPNMSALFLSAYNSNTTTAVRLRFPLGAPILLGMEAELAEGDAVYHLARGEHRECRVFVKQKSGVISCREAAPVSARYRRVLRLRGLSDAEVYLFPETGHRCAAAIGKKMDKTPEYDPRFAQFDDPIYGTCLKGEHVSGDILFMME